MLHKVHEDLTEVQIGDRTLKLGDYIWYLGVKGQVYMIEQCPYGDIIVSFYWDDVEPLQSIIDNELHEEGMAREVPVTKIKYETNKWVAK